MYTDQEKWLLIYGSLAGGLDFKGITRWISRFDTLDEAFEEAMRFRDGMICT